MTILSLASDWGGMPASSVTLLLLKVTAVLCVAIVLDLLLHRRFVLACAAAWNATIVLLIALPLASLLMPGVRLDSESVEHASVSSQPTVATFAATSGYAGNRSRGRAGNRPGRERTGIDGAGRARQNSVSRSRAGLAGDGPRPGLAPAGLGARLRMRRGDHAHPFVRVDGRGSALRRASQQVDDGAWQAKLTDWRKRCCVPRGG